MSSAEDSRSQEPANTSGNSNKESDNPLENFSRSFQVNNEKNTGKPQKNLSFSDYSNQQTNQYVKGDKSYDSNLSDSLNETEELQEGGEWDLLLKKIRNWIKGNNISNQLERARQPFILFLSLIIFLLLVQIYSRILNAIAVIPLAPRIFELTGILWLTWFSAKKLARREDREELISKLLQRWETFSGKSDQRT